MRDHSAPRTHARDTSYDSTLSSYRPHHVCIHIRVHFLHRVRTHRARGASAGYLPRVSFHRYPFHGTIFTLSRVRKNEWRRLRFCGRSSVPWHAVPQRYHQNKLLKWMMSGPTCITSSSSSRSNCWTVWHSPPMLTGVPEKPLTLSSGSCAAYSRALHP